MPPPEPIVTIKHVSYLKLLGVTFQDSPTNCIHILRVCKRNGYRVFDLNTSVIASLCHFLLTVSEFGVFLLITNTLVMLWRRAFRFGYIAISRKVVGKNVHVTIPKGNMGYNQYTVPDTVAVEPTLVTFL